MSLFYMLISTDAKSFGTLRGIASLIKVFTSDSTILSLMTFGRLDRGSSPKVLSFRSYVLLRAPSNGFAWEALAPTNLPAQGEGTASTF
jgi:hypothetical protein